LSDILKLGKQRIDQARSKDQEANAEGEEDSSLNAKELRKELALARLEEDKGGIHDPITYTNMEDFNKRHNLKNLVKKIQERKQKEHNIVIDW
jgi:hypothetical protein